MPSASVVAPQTEPLLAAPSPRSPIRGSSSTRLPVASLTIASALSVLLRLRMYWTPITSDEGGFLVIARSWAHGATLYRDVWVDRPQGIIVLYRFWDWVSGGSVASVRIMAMLFGVGLVVAVGSVASQIAGRSAGAVAAILVAATSANPAIEGHLANGELLGGAVAVAGLAVGIRAITSGRTRLLIVSGVAGGLALSLKQSGFEGLGTVALWLLLAPRFGWRTLRAALRDLAALIGGVAIVATAAVVQGATSGLSRWWYAVVAHRFEERSAVAGPTWGRLWSTFLVAGPILLPLAMTCVLAWAVLRSPNAVPRRSSIRVPHVLGIWAVVVAISFVLGGNFFRHYWLTWCPLLSVAAGAALARLMTRRVATFAAVVLLTPGLFAAAAILQLPRREAGATASDDDRLRTDEPVAAWFLSVRRPGETMFAMCASPALYADAGLDAPVPYLWRDHVRLYPGAIARIADALTTTPPRYLALVQRPDRCDPTGRLAQIVDRDYVGLTNIAGTPVLERRSPP